MEDKKKKVLTLSVIIYAVAFMFIIVMMNFEKFDTFITWLNDKLSVFTPILLGAIFAYLCTPLVKLFQRSLLKNVKNNVAKRGFSILLSYVLLLAMIIIFAFMIFPQLISSIEDLMRKMTDGTYMNFALDKVNGFLNRFLNNGGGDVQIVDKNKINNMINNFFMGSEDILQQGLNLLISYGTKIFTSVKNIFIGLLLSIYFVINKEKLYAQTKKILTAIFSKKKCESIYSWSRFADKTFGGFIIGKILDALFMITVCSIAFGIAGIPYAILIAVVIGVCNIIPFFGPFIGAIPSGLIILIANPSKFVLFVILTLIIQQIDANLVEPKIVGSRTGLSSLGVIVAIMIMSGYFGLIGMFFGVPIFAIIYSIIMSFIDGKLKRKKLSVELSDYYSENSIVDPNREVVSLSARIFGFFGKKIVTGEKKIADLITKKKEETMEATSIGEDSMDEGVIEITIDIEDCDNVAENNTNNTNETETDNEQPN
jgi:predicted PurR-regulated permease PerM